MDIYIILPIIILCFHLLSFLQSKKVRVFCYIVLSVIFFLIAGFRECGFDYEAYESLFHIFKHENWFMQSLIYSTEIGYAFASHISPSLEVLIMVTTFIIIYTQFKFIFQHSKFPFLSLFFYMGLFFYSSLMGQYRQAFALGMILLAISHIENKKKFLLYVFIGFLFHYTAIIALILLYIPKKLFSLKKYLLVLVCSFAFSFIFPLVFKSFISFSSYLTHKTDAYENAEYELITGINSVMIIRIFLFLVCYYYRKKLTLLKNMDFYLNIYFLSLIIYLVFSFIPALASRGSAYFSFFEIILVSNLIFVLRKNSVRILILVVFLGLAVARQMKIFQEEDFNNSFYPYKNWLIK